MYGCTDALASAPGGGMWSGIYCGHFIQVPIGWVAGLDVMTERKFLENCALSGYYAAIITQKSAVLVCFVGEA
jgi:hypothetical protein